MELAGAVAGRDAGPEGGVRVHALARRRAREELEEDLEVLERGHELLDPDDGDERAGKGGAEAAVAFGLDDADGACFGDGEVCAADADARLEKPLPQVRARCACERGRLLREIRDSQLLAEEVADLESVLVDRGD